MNHGVGGFVSQRRTVQLPCAAPREDSDVVSTLRDLLVTTSPQLGSLLERQVISAASKCGIQDGARIRKQFGEHGWYEGTIQDVENGFYKIQYDDGQVECLPVEDILSILQSPIDADDRRLLDAAIEEQQAHAAEKAKSKSDLDQYGITLSKKPLEFFGTSAVERRQLCYSLHNYCVYKHQLWQCSCDKGVNPWKRSKGPRDPCLFHHDPRTCKCNREAHVMGQDESVFHAYLLGSKVWYCEKVVGLRKKSTGPGCHVSGFVDEVFGFGLPLTAEQLNIVNHYREGKLSAVTGKERATLTTTPGTRLLMIGQHKDGWWTLPLLMEQCEDVMDCLEVLRPHVQVIGSFDNSVQHCKKGSDGLRTTYMAVTWGGRY